MKKILTTAAISAAAVISVGTGIPAAAAAPPAQVVQRTPVTLACQVDWPFDNILFSLNHTSIISGPSTVAPNQQFTWSGAAAPTVVPTEMNGATITALTDFTITTEVTGSATILSSSLSGGSNLGPGKPTLTVSGNKETLKIPGPLKAGTTVTMPTINTKLRAGASGTANVKMSGTSYSNPGLRLTSHVPNGSEPEIVIGAGCYPSPSPNLATTRITP
jgi:dehydratase